MAPSSSKTFENSLFFQQVYEYICDGKEVAFSLRGSSMSPFLKEGDLITVKPLTGVSLKIGHIVLAYFKNGYILHRIIRLDQDYVYIAGDANLVQIEKIERKSVIGLLCEASRHKNNIPLYTLRMLCYAKLWYYMRPFRRVWAKLFKRKIHP
ncbi:S24/S26 family peptidase [Sphingobacterium sp. lm-10]|uniref:S24/S26 family peptidase n=1 Tax=Sphingobacterium sp. lm-10 TaxID=2944904 RepID=UPI002021939B|nr:S24/S26 family peptidase [Sphingobacterium sp. lm-10]MCL7988420.1 S24/S26 family peptidase [Sphingobacterium sp. lm-10]MCL8000541.1 S24/S26 family peptidase [Brucella sp. 21LCYQ03]